MAADDPTAGSVAEEASTFTEDDYLDFDLLVEKTDTGHRARVLSSPAGQAQHDFVVPFEPVHVDNLMLRFGRTRGTRRASMHFRNEAETFGRDLYQAVFDDEVRLAFRQSCDEAERQGRGLRLRLRLDDVWLETLPWEFLHSDYVDDFLVLSRHTPLVRFIEMRSLGTAPKIALPLRVVVMIASPSDYDPLDTEAEWQRLQEAMRQRIDRGEIELVRVPNGSLAALRSTLQDGEYHIFHFIGHAAYDDKFDDGVLIMEGDDGRSRIVPGRDLGTILADQKATLRLAVLNACEGARTSLEDRFSGVAQSLIRRQLPAVIAMQFEITDDAAITLSRDFYGALVAGLPVDAALSEARRGLFSVGNQVEWATPVLYQRSGSGQIFDIDDAAPLRIEQPVAKIIEVEPAVGAEAIVPVDQEPVAEVETGVPAEPARPAQTPPAPDNRSRQPPDRSPPTPASADNRRGVSAGVLVLAVVLGVILLSQFMNRTNNDDGVAATANTPVAEPVATTAPTVAPTAVPTVAAPEVVNTAVIVPTVEPTQAPEGNDLTPPSISPELETLIERLAADVDLPLRVPLTDFASFDGTPFADQIFFETFRSDATGYDVEVTAAEGCDFGGACHVGGFGGGRLESYELHSTGEFFHLGNGQLAEWFEAECGASCGDAMVRWLEGTTLYYVAIKGGARADVVRLANAATDLRAPHVIDSTVTPQQMNDRPVEIDGRITEWGGVTRHLATLPIFANQWDRVPDGYAQFGFGIDDEHLYVLAEVFDDMFDQANTGTSVFAGDAVNINIAQCCGSTVPNADDFQLTVSALGDPDGEITGAIYFGDGQESSFFPDARTLPSDVRAAISETGAGYDVEIAIPRRYLGDDAFHLLASVNDSDGESRQSAVIAHIPNPFGLADDLRNWDVIDNGLTVFSNPSEWGSLVVGP